MLKGLLWIGLFVGTPSVITWGASEYASFVDQFVVFFGLSVFALLVAILPRLLEPAART